MTYIGTNLRYLRKLSKLSQQALASEIGLNRGNIASYEKGAAEPNTQNLLKIVRYFNIDVVDFVENDLSNLVEEKRVEVNPEAESIIFRKGNLPDLVDELKSQNQDSGRELSSSVEVLADRSASLHLIIEGIRQFYRLAEERTKQGLPPSYEEIHLDFRRSLDLITELQDINRQLFRVILERNSPQQSSAGRQLAEKS